MTEFEEIGLGPEIQKAIAELGFETPTPVQAKVIPFVLSNSRDLVALAQTGTGKTAAFGLPLLEKVKKGAGVQVLILAPTRELCIQISKDMLSFAKFKKDINIVPVYGGAKIDTQIRELRRGAEIVVGTPGRLNDMLRRRMLDVSGIKWLVLDEADEMLTMGFRDELESILSTTPDEKQILLFSATAPQSLKDNFMKNPEEFVLGKRNAGNENIEHRLYMVKSPDRYVALKRIVDNSPGMYGIVFCRTRNETKEVSDKLIKDGYNSDALHGELTQVQRDHVMKKFREKHLTMLVATDVAARGLDVNDLTHVINYNLPDDVEVYTHRSGRTGRAGKKGISLAIINTREQRKIDAIKGRMKITFEKCLVPGGREICQTRLFELIKGVEDVEVRNDEIDLFIEPILKQLAGIERDELIKRFVSVEFNRFLEYYQNAKDINVTARGNSDRGSRDGGRDGGRRGRDRESGRRGRDEGPRFDRGSRGGEGRTRQPRRDDGDRNRAAKSRGEYNRLYINAGRKDGIGVVELIGLVKKETRMRNIDLGTIDVKDKMTFFEVLPKDKTKVLESFKGAILDDRSLRVEEADADAAPASKRGGRKPSESGERKSSDKRTSFKGTKVKSAKSVKKRTVKRVNKEE